MRTFSPVSRARFAVLGGLLVACSAASEPEGAAPPAPAGPAAALTCAEGFVSRAPGGCAPVLPDAACQAGTRPQLGEKACVPVGVTACPAGFVKHASGWGCDVVLPEDVCEGATREHLGDTTCAPIDDCGAAFPPANATLFVSAAFAAGDVNATHFKTIGAALAAATPGAVIAIDEGTYLEAPSIVTAVTLVGRCASKVILTSADGTGKGLQARVKGVAASHLTLRGFELGVFVAGGGLDLSSAIVETNRYAGVFADKGARAKLSNVVVRGTHMLLTDKEAYGVLAQSGAQVDVEDSVVQANDFVNLGSLDAKTRLRVDRSIVRKGTHPATPRVQSGGAGALVTHDGTLEVHESAFVENRDVGIQVLASGGTLVVERSVIRGTLPLDADGVGLLALSGAVSAKETTFISNGRAELSLLGAATGTFESSVALRDDREPKNVTDGAALMASDTSQATMRGFVSFSARNIGMFLDKNARLSLEDGVIVGPRPNAEQGGYAIAMLGDTRLSMKRTTIEGASAAAILVDTGTATIETSLVRGTRSRAGVGGNAVNVQNAGHLDVSRSGFVSNRSIGVGVIGDGATLAMSDVSVLDTDADESGAFGIGVFVAGARATIASSTIGGSKGIGLALAAATGSISSSMIVRNAVAVHAQDGTTIRESEPSDEAPLTVDVGPSTQFVENATRVGSGEVPLPVAF